MRRVRPEQIRHGAVALPMPSVPPLGLGPVTRRLPPRVAKGRVGPSGEQTAYDRYAIARRREHQRRQASRILRVQIGSARDQRIDERRMPGRAREHQQRAARHALARVNVAIRGEPRLNRA